MMTTARKFALGLSLTATALAGGALAARAAQGDGVTTRAEMQAQAAQRFARLDANKDGKLDQADRAARRAAMFDRIDADHNGQISRAEFDAPRGPMAAGEGRRGQGGRVMGMHHRGGTMGGRMMGPGADADKDGAITQAEFTAAAQQRFDRADTNHDGQVTREERQAARQAMRDGMRQRWQDRSGASPAQSPAN